MTLRELHDYLTLIYKAGWDDALEGRPFNPLEPSEIAREAFSLDSEGLAKGSSEIGAQNQFK